MRGKRTASLLLSALLTLTLCLTALPKAARAAGTGAITKGVGILATGANTGAAATVYYGKDNTNPYAWRVIGYNGAGVATSAGNMTLIAAGNLLQSSFDASITSKAYASSSLKARVEEIAAGLSDAEKFAVVKRTLASGDYNESDTNCVAGDAVSDALLWPLSTAEANALNYDLRLADPAHPAWATSCSWLRSPGKEFVAPLAAYIGGGGNVEYSGAGVFATYGVRPAMNLDTSKVLFSAAADNSGQNATFSAPAAYSGTNWKLTIKDGNSFAAGTAKTGGNTSLTTGYAAEALTFRHAALSSFTGAGYTNVTAVLTNAADDLLYYARSTQARMRQAPLSRSPRGLRRATIRSRCTPRTETPPISLTMPWASRLPRRSP